LGVRVELEGLLPGAEPCGNGYTLYVWAGRIVAGTPRPLEHAELRWVNAAELGGLAWLPADVPFLDAVAAQLSAGSGRAGR
jgi:8-oxo-dGTP diphosphatase